MAHAPTECPCCENVYGPMDDERFRTGRFRDTDTDEEYAQVCETCVKTGRVERLN